MSVMVYILITDLSLIKKLLLIVVMDYLESLGIYDKKSYKYWVVQNHSDHGGCTQIFIKVCKDYKKFFDRDGNLISEGNPDDDDVFNDFSASLMTI